MKFIREDNGLSLKELIKIVQRIVSRAEADGCIGCAYIEREEWEQPCNKCRRAAKDYWRAK